MRAESIDFAHRDGVHALGQLRVLDPLAELGDLVAFAFTEFLLNGLELLAQVVLTLRVGHLLLRRRLDLAFDFEQRDLARERRGDDLELLQQIVRLEHLLPVGRLHLDQAGEDIGEPQRVVDVHDHAAQIFGESGGQRERLLDQLLDPPDVALRLRSCARRSPAADDLRPHARPRARDQRRASTTEPLDDDVDPARDLGHLTDDADGADLEQIVGSGILVLVVLQDEEHQAIHTQRAVDRLDRHRAIDGERLQRQRQRDSPSQREDGEFRRKLWSGLGHRGLKALGSGLLALGSP